jgi:hypothetical protein
MFVCSVACWSPTYITIIYIYIFSQEPIECYSLDFQVIHMCIFIYSVYWPTNAHNKLYWMDETECVYCAVRDESLCNSVLAFKVLTFVSNCTLPTLCEGRAVGMRAWTGHWGCRRLRPSGFIDSRPGGKVSRTHQPPVPSRRYPGTHFR